MRRRELHVMAITRMSTVALS